MCAGIETTIPLTVRIDSPLPCHVHSPTSNCSPSNYTLSAHLLHMSQQCSRHIYIPEYRDSIRSVVRNLWETDTSWQLSLLQAYLALHRCDLRGFNCMTYTWNPKLWDELSWILPKRQIPGIIGQREIESPKSLDPIFYLERDRCEYCWE